MRIRLMAAAAAALVTCAGQAEAARYYEFVLVGSANRDGVYDADGKGFRSFNYTSTLTFSYDTNFPATPQGPFANYYGAGATTRPYYNVGVELSAYTGTSPARIEALNSGPGGPVFDFNINLGSVAFGDVLLPLVMSNTAFAYNVVVDPRGPTAYRTNPGQIVSFVGRTSDVAPARLGLTETFAVTVLPEPATWGMMILGFGAVGAAARRGRRQPLALA